jgi:hydroxymethylpyrimidine/phosphomethylpyrimidine kinase
MSQAVPNVLSIAGSDPSGGAGVQADLRTFAALGVYGCAALTALTAQNTMGVSATHMVPASFLRRQLDAVFADVRVDAVKIGMLGTADAVVAVADVLRTHRPPLVVLDPVLRASTGAPLLDEGGMRALREELLPLVTVVTPNADEAGRLLRRPAPRSVPEARAAATLLVARGGRAAVVTGGHMPDLHLSVDVLHDGQDVHECRVPRVVGTGTHGSGCTFSSAIAALLALGLPLPRACREAQRFVAEAIARASELNVGRGAGPVHQLGALWTHAATSGRGKLSSNSQPTSGSTNDLRFK